MSELVANCPRCDSQRMTFDLVCQVPTEIQYGWQQWLEVFCICRACNKPTIFVVSQKEPGDERFVKAGLQTLGFSANQCVAVKRFVSVQDQSAVKPPEHLPENIQQIFNEGAACMAIGCNNAAGTMFRLCLDLATKPLLPEEADGLNNTIRRNLGLRLPWLFDHALLPEALRELSSCIKDDGNDGAHQGTLGEKDAEDILDFTYLFLERMYTEPKRLELAAKRRAERNAPKQ